MSMNTVPERLAALRAAMKANGVDVYLIPVGDPHSSEYLPDHYTSLTGQTAATLCRPKRRSPVPRSS